MEIQDSGGA
jgi:DNA-binding NarL/FixJ family response regulator